jgi:soluble lytic murein transglycosylase-like protein
MNHGLQPISAKTQPVRGFRHFLSEVRVPLLADSVRRLGFTLAVVVVLANAPGARAAEGVGSVAGSVTGTAEVNAELSKPAVKAALVTPAPYALDGIMAVKDERGRTIYVNAPAPPPVKPAASVSRRSSNLVYWSSKENQWKPVPPPSPSAMRAARTAAAEVLDYMQEKATPQTATRKPPEAAPAASNASTSGHRKSYNEAVLTELHRGTSAPAPARSVERGTRNELVGPGPTTKDQRPTTTAHVVSAQEIDEAIERAAARHQVDPNLVRAMIKVESNFNPRAVSKKGAMGLMQLMPATARSLEVSHPFDPSENVDAGVRHLRTLLDNYGGNVRLSLAAYNAGATAVARHNGVPTNPETTNYVKQITNLYSNGGSSSMFLRPRPGTTPVRVFRDGSGVLTMTNE